MIGQVSIAAAVAVAGFDLAASTTWRVAGVARVLNSVGLAGSAAALDSKIDVFVGNQKVGEMFNSSTGAVNRNTDMFRIGEVVPAGTPISMLVTDAPATNPLNAAADLS